jgi:REP element-mobilizing transposase RayT
MPIPLAYLITFSCYGTRLHGDEAGSVDRNHRIPTAPFAPPKPARAVFEENRMTRNAFHLEDRQRQIVLEAIQQHCIQRNWSLRAVHVRSTHVHLVVSAETTPEKILNDVKAYSSRALNRCSGQAPVFRRWTRHGSTRYLWNAEGVAAAVRYVVEEQGEPMAVWLNKDEELL